MKSYTQFLEALKGKQHKIDKNKNGKIDAHDFKLLRKEESEELTEAKVETKKYSWGTMKTVHHGADFSIPLHPEHHKAIAKLKDEQEHKFKTEDGKHWTARRKGDDVHFQGANNGGATKVKHSDLKEETEIDEAEDRMARADYKVGPSGRKSHKQIVFANSDKKEEKEMKEQAPVAPVPDRKYIKGTPEYKAYMATKKTRVGHPTNEEVELEEGLRSMLMKATGVTAKDVANSTISALNKKAPGTKMHNHPNFSKFKQEVHAHISSAKSAEEAMKRSSDDHVMSLAKKHFTEEVEQIDEISKKTLGSYVSKASVDMANRTADATHKKTLAGADYAHNISRGMDAKTADKHMKSDYEDAKPDVKKAVKRMHGINKAVNRLTKEETDKKKEDDLPFTPDKPKKNPSAVPGKFGIGPSTAKHLAKMGMKKVMKEEDETSEKMEMAQTQLHFIKYAAEEILEYIDMGGEVEEWYQNKLSKVMSEVESLHSYIEGEKRRTGMVDEEVEEIDELNKSTLASYAKKATHDSRMNQKIAKDFEAQSNKSRKPDMKTAADRLAGHYQKKSWKRQDGVNKAIDRLAKEEVELDEKINLATSKMGDVIKDFQASDAPQFAGKSKEKRREMAIAAKLEADRGTKKEETEMLSYKEFMMMLEYEAKGGVYRHTGTYGSEYAKKEREKDEQGFDAKDDNQTQKRGRGRPAGAKSGARGPRIK